MTLAEGTVGQSYTVSAIETDDDELDGFLFSLGCYSGETVSIVSAISRSIVITIRDGRYNIDKNLASAIIVE